MKKRFLRYRAHYRRSLDERSWAPLVRLGACVLCVALLAAGGFFGVRALLSRAGEGPVFTFGGRTPKPSPTPEPTPVVTATPEPRRVFTGTVKKLPLYALGTDPMLEPSLSERGIVFVTGADPASPDRLYTFSFETGRLRKVRVPFTEGALRNPIWTDGFLAVEELREDKGILRVLDPDSGLWHDDAQFRYGAPPLFAEGPLVAYTARTGESTASLFVIDPVRGMGAEAASFDTPAYGAGRPDLDEGALVYADYMDDGTPGLVRLDLHMIVPEKIPLSFVPHDPKSGDGFIACLDAPHTEDAGLMVVTRRNGGEEIAADVGRYDAEGEFVLYEKDGGVQLYVPSQELSHTLMKDASLLCTGDGMALLYDGADYWLVRLEYGYAEE